MAIINKTGITNGGTIQAEHVTRAIDALSGGSADTIVATGSFSGSFRGDGSGLTGVGGDSFPYTGSAIVSGSLIITGSLRVNATGSDAITLTSNAITLAGSAGSLHRFLAATSSFGDSMVLKDTGVVGPVGITGSVSTLMISGAFENMINVKNVLVTYGDIVYGNTFNAVKVGNIVSLDYATNKWLPVSQSSYDSTRLPILGTALDIATNGRVLLSGYVTAYQTGSTNGAGIAIQEDETLHIGNSVFLRESDIGVTSNSIPTGGEVIHVGHVIHTGSAFTTNYVVRFDPKWIKTI